MANKNKLSIYLIKRGIFSLTVSRDINNIDELLIFCYRRYMEETYRERFAWIDNIKYVREKAAIERLNTKLIQMINEEAFDRVWMAVPEVVKWEDISLLYQKNPAAGEVL